LVKRKLTRLIWEKKKGWGGKKLGIKLNPKGGMLENVAGENFKR